MSSYNDQGKMCACAATIVDVVTTGALVTVSQRSGVSLNINVDYLNAVPCGEHCHIEARVMKVCMNLLPVRVEALTTLHESLPHCASCHPWNHASLAGCVLLLMPSHHRIWRAIEAPGVECQATVPLSVNLSSSVGSQVGKTIATMQLDLWHLKNGQRQLAAQGRHIKFLSPKEHQIVGLHTAPKLKL